LVGWRHSEITAFGPEVVSLADAEALIVFQRGSDCSSRSRYGLNEAAFPQTERLDVNESGPAAGQWLAERVGDEELFLVFAKDEVFRVPAALFLEHWQDMLCPSRDDAIILPVGGGWAMFYYHHDEFEFARGGPA
jgi:hypothetical protein